MTKEQEEFLIEFANKGLAEITEAKAREEEITKNATIQAAKESLLAELDAKQKAEKEAKLQEFEEVTVPSLLDN